MSKVNKKELIKFAKQVNKLKLTEDPIDLKGDVEDIQEDFISAIEEIDDDGTIDELDDKVIDFYETLIDDDEEDDKDEDEDDDDDDDDEDDEEEEEKPKKKAKKEKKGKKAKKEKKGKKKVVEEDEEDEEDDDDDDDDDEEEKPKKKAKKGKKGKKAKKEKKGEKAKSSVDLPKGLRTGTLPAVLYEKIVADGGETTWEELAKVYANVKGKKKAWEKCMNPTFRTMSRKVSKAIPVTVRFEEGEETTAVFSVSVEDDE